MIVDRILSLLSLFAFAAFFGFVLWFAPELDLIIITTLVIAIAAYFLISSGFKQK